MGENNVSRYGTDTSFQLKRFSIWKRQVKELLKGINVLLGSFYTEYDIENTSTWSLGGQRIFLRKNCYPSSTLSISMKFCENKNKNENTPAYFHFSSYFCKTSCWSKGLKKGSQYCVKKFFDVPMTRLKRFQCHIARRNRQEAAKQFSKMENLFM